MKTEIFGVVLQILIPVLLAYPLGKYIAKVYKGEKVFTDFLKPLERLIYKAGGVNPEKEMDWKKFLKTLLILNFVWFFWGFALLLLQGVLPLNPDGNHSQDIMQAFNTSVSFMVNCNMQHYAGESGVTYLTQILVVMMFQFVAAATGMAAMAGIMQSIAAKTSKTIGNFWNYFIKSLTRILIPLSLIAATVYVIEGVPMTFDGKEKITTLEGGTQYVSQGPVAAVVAIKQLGTNGGGFFGANSSHPLENPTYITNVVEFWSILLIPMALVFAFGFYVNRRKMAMMIFGTMLFAFLLTSAISISEESRGNRFISEMGIDQSSGAMEGKEVRIGSESTALWGIATTATSNGSVNGMHDSMMPLSGMLQMLNMQINTWFGGVGVGWMNYYTFIIIAVFISGLMVGRTPEFMGKKIGAREMKIAILIALLHPFLILGFTAMATYLLVHAPGFVSGEGGWLNNEGYHGLSEMLYKFTSASANNGSGFEGLNDNNFFWNLFCGIVLLISRYVPIIGQLAIAGFLAGKKYTPESVGTLKTDTVTFAVMTFVVIFIVAALSFFPVHALSSIADSLAG